MKWLGALAALMASLTVALAPSPAFALDARTDEVVIIDEGTVVDDDLAAAAQSVYIAGEVRGDVIAAAQLVTVTGVVHGDLIVVGQKLDIGGIVHGDIRALGAQVFVNGRVDRNVLAAGGDLSTSLPAVVGGSVTGAGRQASINGRIDRALAVAAEHVTIGGAIGGDARVRAETLRVTQAAQVDGALEYWSDATADIAVESVSGRIERHDPERTTRISEIGERLAALAGRIWLIGSGIAALVLAMVVALAAPSLAGRIDGEIRAQPVAVVALGLATLVLPIVAAAILALTLIGLPLAALIGAAWAVGSALGWTAAGAALGRALARAGGASGEPRRWTHIAGVVLLWLAGMLPGIGATVTAMAAAVGLGALIAARRRARVAGPSGTEPVEAGVATESA